MKSYRDLFKSTAWYYARYRPVYPQEFLGRIVDRFRLDGTGRLLDLGCGTGQLAISLSNYFAEVVGLDPEPEMLAEAHNQAQAAGAWNIEWIEGGSEDLEDLRPQLGGFQLITMGNSFHWMDRDATLRILHGIVVPDGGIVMVNGGNVVPGGSIAVESEHNHITVADWQQVVKAVIRRWLGEARRAGSSIYEQAPDRHTVVFARSPFKRLETIRYEHPYRWTIDTIIGHLYSTSYCSRAVLGEKQAGFEEDLRKSLLELNPAGEFTEDLYHEAILAWRE